MWVMMWNWYFYFVRFCLALREAFSFSLGFCTMLSFSFFLLVQKEREKEKRPPKTNAPHVLGLAIRCCYAEYVSSVVSANAHDGAIGRW